MEVSTLEWGITLAVTIGVLLFDVIVIARNPHEPSLKECATALSVYVGAAIAFGAWVWIFHGHDFGIEFYTGWLVEYSLSVDNLFVFIVLMAALNVPRKYQQEALMVGIILALVFRGIFIAVGYTLIDRFVWVFFIFGAFLVYTAVQLVRSYRSHEDEHPEDNRIVKFAQSHLNVGEEYRGLKLWWKDNGVRVFSPMVIVILALGMTDILFALDSIPAIFGITQEPYLVFTANVFALMGLRQLYFLLGGLLKRLVYLSLGLSFILAWIGVKLVIHALHEYHVIGFEVPTLMSLGVILVTLAVTAVASLRKTRKERSRRTPDLPGIRAGGDALEEAMTSSDAGPALSVLDLVPVRSDQTSGDALAATVSLARTADELGFRRYWLAEHHNMPAVAATNPPVLIAMVAGATQRIRVGSGGVMLPNHAPLVVAEQFALLEAAHPGRIDLGIGRAPGTDPVTSWALRHGAGGVSDEAVERFPQYVDDVLAMMDTDGAAVSVAGRRHPLRATPRATGVADVWLLGSSDYSARLAAEKGLPYVFAHHFSGSGTAQALELYRSQFRPSPGAGGAADLPDPQRRSPRHAGGGRAAGAAAAAVDAGAAHRSAAHPQRLVEEAEKAELPEPHRDLVDAMRARWVIGDAAERPARRSPTWPPSTAWTR